MLVKSVRLLSLIGVLALISSKELDALILIVFFLLFFIGIQIDRFPLLAQTLGKAQPFLALVVFLLAVIDFIFLSRSFLLTVAHFLLSLQGLRLLALKKLRDSMGSILLSSLMILSAATLAVEWTFFVMLFMFLPAVIWTIILLNLFYENQELGNIHVIGDRSPDGIQSLKALRQSTLLACGVAVLVCSIVFMTFPRFNFQGFRGRFLQPVHKTGFTEQVNLDQGGSIYEDPSIVMRVEMNTEDRDLWSGYLRGGTLDTFDGQTWKNSDTQVTPFYRDHRSEITMPIPKMASKKIIKQSIYLESLDSDLLFFAEWPYRIKVERPFLHMASDYSVRRRRGDTWRLHYEVESLIPEEIRHSPESGSPGAEAHAPRHLKEAGSISGQALDGDDGQKLMKLVNEVTGGIDNKFEAARRIESYLRENYEYTLNLEKNISQLPLEDFLFRTKKGHCEYFASAMTIMLRVVNIPARMVTGFVANEWNDEGQYYVVRMDDAHAWVEAYFENYGWRRFDPSPRSYSGTTNISPWLKRFSNVMDNLNLTWNRYILSYDMERQFEIVQGVTSQSKRVSVNLAGLMGRFKNIFSWSPGAVSNERPEQSPMGKGALIFFSAIFIFLIFVQLKNHSQKKKSVWFYKQLLNYLEKKGGPKPASMTLREYVHQLKVSLGLSFSDVDFLTAQYYAARFNPGDDAQSSQNSSVRQALKRLK